MLITEDNSVYSMESRRNKEWVDEKWSSNNYSQHTHTHMDSKGAEE